MVQSKAGNNIQNELDRFSRKYLFRQILLGALRCILTAGIPFSVLLVINELFITSTGFRTVSMYVLYGISVISILIWIIYPMLRLIKWLPGIQPRRAEAVIRHHFPEIRDVLLNIIELKEDLVDSRQEELVIASIEEKSKRIGWFDFSKAISYKRMVVPGLVISVVFLIGAVLSIASPEFVKQGYAKTVHYKQSYNEEGAVSIRILNDSLRIGLGEDLQIMFQVNNAQEEENVWVRMGERFHRMDWHGDTAAYVFEKVNGSFSFQIETEGYSSQNYVVEVIPIPQLVDVEMIVTPLSYTRIEPSITEIAGSHSMPIGSQIRWKMQTANADHIVYIGIDNRTVKAVEGGEMVFTAVASEPGLHEFQLVSDKIEKKAIIPFEIEVIEDQYPAVEASRIEDSIYTQQVYLQANIQDDYGFSKAEFIVEDLANNLKVLKQDVPIKKMARFQKVYHAVDFDSIGEGVEAFRYFLRVWDNDGYNGSKYTDSEVYEKTRIDEDALFDANRERSEGVKNAIKDGKGVLEQIEESVNDLVNSQLRDDKEDWEMKGMIEEIKDMEDILKELIGNIQDENRIIQQTENSSGDKRQEILRKQAEIQELFENILDEELRKLFEEFEELAKNLNKRDILEKAEELKMNLENIERQLDVNLELLKKLQLEKELYKLANDAKELGKDVKEKREKVTEEVEKRVDEIEEKFEKQLEENKSLEKPHDLKELKEERERIKEKIEELKKAEEEIEREEDMMGDEETKRKNRSKVEQKRGELGEEIEKWGDEIQNMMTGAGGASNAVDIEMLRQLSRELNDFSFEQESLLEKIRRVNARSKVFHDVGKKQKDLEMKFQVISDSLLSLGYKQAMIANLLQEEVFHVETSMSNLFRHVQDGRVQQVRYEQQKVMEGTNELAVRLDEMINSLEAMSGKGNSGSSFTDSKPKDGGEQMGEMRGKQNALKEQLKGMIKQMKSGKQSGGKGQGKEMARMLAEREMLRQALEQLKNSGSVGNEAQGKINEVQRMMEDVEKDIIYDRVSDITVAKEEWIQSRLLEAEKAEKERDKENKREAEEFKGKLSKEDPSFWEDIEEENRKQAQIMRFQDVKLKSYYKKKYNRYIEKLNNKKEK